jgi:hypothetical protein
MSEKIIKYNDTLLSWNDEYIRTGSAAVVPTEGLVAKYLMEDNLTDGTGTYSLTGAPSSYVTGKVGKASQWTGQESYNVALRTLSDNNNAHSISFWAKRSSASGVIFASDGANNSPYKRMWIAYSTDYISYERYNATTMGGVGGIGTSFNSLTFSTGVWYHFVIVYSGSEVYLYQDGVEKTQTSNANWTTYKATTMSTGSTTSFVVAGNNQNNKSAYQGDLDQVYIYNRALTAIEVAALYNSGTGL